MARSWHSIVVTKTTLLLPGVVRLGALGIRLHVRLRFGFAHQVHPVVAHHSAAKAASETTVLVHTGHQHKEVIIMP